MIQCICHGVMLGECIYSYNGTWNAFRFIFFYCVFIIETMYVSISSIHLNTSEISLLNIVPRFYLNANVIKESF